MQSIARLPRQIDPQLHKRAAPEGDRWLHEVKYDGWRMLCRLEGGAVRLFSRSGREWRARLPGIDAAAARLGAESAYLDGELVRFTDAGGTDLEALQTAMRVASGQGNGSK